MRLALRGEVRRKRHLYFATLSVRAADGEVVRVTAVLAVLPAA